MKDYKYIIFNEDVLVHPAQELLYRKGQTYEIVKIYNSTRNTTLLVETKNPSMVKYASDCELFTLIEMRRHKLDLIKKKLCVI
jgi:hypothetical protein